MRETTEFIFNLTAENKHATFPLHCFPFKRVSLFYFSIFTFIDIQLGKWAVLTLRGGWNLAILAFCFLPLYIDTSHPAMNAPANLLLCLFFFISKSLRIHKKKYILPFHLIKKKLRLGFLHFTWSYLKAEPLKDDNCNWMCMLHSLFLLKPGSHPRSTTKKGAIPQGFILPFPVCSWPLLPLFPPFYFQLMFYRCYEILEDGMWNTL